MGTRRRLSEREEQLRNEKFLKDESHGQASVFQGRQPRVYTSNLEARIAGLRKLDGKTVKVGDLYTGFDPRKHPNCLYVPLPEYGLYLLHSYPTESKETK